MGGYNDNFFINFQQLDNKEYREVSEFVAALQYELSILK
jgi:hypothetical protein